MGYLNLFLFILYSNITKNKYIDMEKAVLSIRVSHDFYNRLKNIVPKGQIGDFIEKATDKELIKKQSNLGSAYQECYANNPHLLELARK